MYSHEKLHIIHRIIITPLRSINSRKQVYVRLTYF